MKTTRWFLALGPCSCLASRCSFPLVRPRSHTLCDDTSAPTATVCVTLIIAVTVNTDFKRCPYFPSFRRTAAAPIVDTNLPNRQFDPSSDLKRTIRHIVHQRRENMCKHRRFFSFLCGISWRMRPSVTVYWHFSRLKIKRRHWQDSETWGEP